MTEVKCETCEGTGLVQALGVDGGDFSRDPIIHERPCNTCNGTGAVWRPLQWCNGMRLGTSAAEEGTIEPCEHARWDDGPWDVGDGHGQWRLPEGHGAALAAYAAAVRGEAEVRIADLEAMLRRIES